MKALYETTLSLGEGDLLTIKKDKKEIYKYHHNGPSKSVKITFELEP